MSTKNKSIEPDDVHAAIINQLAGTLSGPESKPFQADIGRDEISQELVNRHRGGLNSALADSVKESFTRILCK